MDIAGRGDDPGSTWAMEPVALHGLPGLGPQDAQGIPQEPGNMN